MWDIVAEILNLDNKNMLNLIGGFYEDKVKFGFLSTQSRIWILEPYAIGPL